MLIISTIKKIIKARRRNIKFEEIANMWLESKKNYVKESTYYNYMFKINKYLIPKFKEKNITEIYSYNEYINKLSEQLSYSTVKDIIIVLKSILRYYEDEFECKLKVKNINLPKREKIKLEILNKKEQRKLERYCEKENSILAQGIIVCLNTGLRIGEICALKWNNVNFENRKIYVTNTLQRVYKRDENKTEIIIRKAKTEMSVREIPMNNKVYEILKNIKRKHKNSEFVIVKLDGNIVEPRYYQDYFKKILKANKIKKYKFHILRHTFASNCVEIGMDAKTLSEILGHSDVSTTLNIYVHSSDEIKEKYLKKLNKK